MTTIEQVDLKKRKIEKLKKEISVLQEKCKQTTQPATDDGGWKRGQIYKADNNLEKDFST